MLATQPFGKFAYIGIQAVNAPQVKSKFADTLAGEAVKKTTGRTRRKRSER